MVKNQHFGLQCKALGTENPQIVRMVQPGFECRCNVAMRRKVGF